MELPVMRTECVDTLVVGGGQAGLTMSHQLGLAGRPHIVLERGRIAERWRSERWDGLRFQFPNWSIRLPDFAFPHTGPDDFAASGEIVDFLAAYAAHVRAPVRCNTVVNRLTLAGDGTRFLADTSGGPIIASNVVVATGPYQEPILPDLLHDVDVIQLHASRYRNPSQLPHGAVLVVGSGASGSQIAEELLRAGRQVYLSVGRHRRMPRRYRGHDLIWWLSTLGLDQMPVERRGPETALPLITGAYGGHTIDFREFAEQGIVLLGRLASGNGSIFNFAADLADNLAKGDAAYHGFLDLVDEYVERYRLDLPADPQARIGIADPSCLTEPIRTIDVREASISAVIWATGYRYAFDWIDLPVVDRAGAPVHRGGLTGFPGLYFLGLPWLSKMNSSFLSGIGDDATRLARHLIERTSGARAAASLMAATGAQ
jgi:putative flavoprotein involved in K+ transport